MWQDLHQSPAITTMTVFCMSDRGANCSCKKLGRSTINIVDCPGHYNTQYPAWLICQFQCTCPPPSSPALKPDPNPLSDLERYLSRHPWPF